MTLQEINATGLTTLLVQLHKQVQRDFGSKYLSITAWSSEQAIVNKCDPVSGSATQLNFL